MIRTLQSTVGGVTIDKQRFNVLCFADDVLLVSVTASGLQNLIIVAQQYVSEHGLGFNPEKTFCSINGKNPWYKSYLVHV